MPPDSAPKRHPGFHRHRGFTLLELMVVVAIAAILAALAAPSLRDFVMRNKMASIGNEFTGGLLRARNEAVSKNTCVTMCMSSTVDSENPSCEGSGQDWQIGWIAFLDPGCANPNAPADRINILFMRQGNAGDYKLSSSRRSIEFGPRGLNGLSNAGQFDVWFKNGSTPETQKFGFSICLSALGRTRTIAAGATCS